MDLISGTVDQASSPQAKITLFRSLFRGRDDVYRVDSRAARLERESLLSFQLVTSCCTGRVEQEVPAFAGNRTRDDDEQVVF
jgi:hypothetical protein